MASKLYTRHRTRSGGGGLARQGLPQISFTSFYLQIVRGDRNDTDFGYAGENIRA